MPEMFGNWHKNDNSISEFRLVHWQAMLQCNFCLEFHTVVEIIFMPWGYYTSTVCVIEINEQCPAHKENAKVTPNLLILKLHPLQASKTNKQTFRPSGSIGWQRKCLETGLSCLRKTANIDANHIKIDGVFQNSLRDHLQSARHEQATCLLPCPPSFLILPMWNRIHPQVIKSYKQWRICQWVPQNVLYTLPITW